MFLTTHAAALRLGVSCDTVRWHERQGHLTTIKVERSPGSFQKVYLAEDVERFRQEREAAALARQAHDKAIAAGVAP
jgi:hypothetical protein